MASPASDPRRNRALGAIHVGKRDLGLDDVTYRALLMRVAGVRSAADLDASGRDSVIPLRPRSPPRTHRYSGAPP